jgi:hypothetical protein
MITSLQTLNASFAHLSKQQLYAFGINHHTAPLAIRAQISSETVRLDEALRDLVF